ncbi:MAG: phosphatase PAP2 family protein [Actinomycetota bacterium]|nr:phosphatase PAP2 family protein [Actinomycetota bacterium]
MSLSALLLIANVRVLWPQGLNTSFYLDLNNFSRHTAWAHGFMHAYALWLGPVLLTIVFLLAYAYVWWRRWPHAAAVLFLGGAGTVIALGFNQLVAHAAQELRPYHTHVHALVLVGKTTDYSFPSDHSIVAGGLTAAVVLGALHMSQRLRETGPAAGSEASRVHRALTILWIVNLVLGLFLCFGRVYVGAHYPGDVVAGFLLSFLTVVCMMLLRPLAYRLVDAIEPTVLGALVRRPGLDPLGIGPSFGGAVRRRERLGPPAGPS